MNEISQSNLKVPILIALVVLAILLVFIPVIKESRRSELCDKDSLSLVVSYTNATTPSLPFEGVLCLTEEPELNKQTTLRYTFVSTTDIPGVTVEIGLPDNIIFVNGETLWVGDLLANETRVVSVVIQVTELGRYRIEATAKSQPDFWFTFNLSDTIEFEVADKGVTFGPEGSDGSVIRSFFNIFNNNQLTENIEK